MTLAMLQGAEEEFLNNVPLDALIRMMSVIGAAGFKDDEHLEWNGLVWYVAAWHGALWNG